jgi:hypothetical protein
MSNARKLASMIEASRLRKRLRIAVRMLSTGSANIAASSPRATMFFAPGAPASFASCPNGTGTQRNAESSGGGASSGSCRTMHPAASGISLRKRAKSANRNTMSASLASPCAAIGTGEMRTVDDDSPPRIWGPYASVLITCSPTAAQAIAARSPATTAPSPPEPTMEKVTSSLMRCSLRLARTCGEDWRHAGG